MYECEECERHGKCIRRQRAITSVNAGPLRQLRIELSYKNRVTLTYLRGFQRLHLNAMKPLYALQGGVCSGIKVFYASYGGERQALVRLFNPVYTQ